MIDFTNKTPETQKDIRILLKLLIKATEIREPDDKSALKIPKLEFTSEHIGYQRGLNILELLSQQGSLYNVLNEKHKRLLRESDPMRGGWEGKNEELKKAYSQLKTKQEDLDKYFLLEVKDSNIVEKLKRELDSIDQGVNSPIKTGRKTPKCIVKGGIGYIVIGRKKSKPFKDLKSRQWNLIQQLTKFFGLAKSDETIYDEIKLQQDRDRYPELNDQYKRATCIATIIETTIGEIQRNFAASDLSSILSLHHKQNKVWLNNRK